MPFLYPTLRRASLTDVTVADLHRLGVRGILLDVDNTLTTHASQTLPPEVEDWLHRMAAEGFALTVVSNSWERRVAPFAAKIGLRHISLACKPSPLGLWRGVRRLGCRREECVAIGDQLFTDVLGAKLGGLKIILLEPREREIDRPRIMFKRRWEDRIKRRWKENDQ